MPWTLSGFADEAAENIDGQIQATKDAGLSHIDLRGLDGYNISELPLDHAETVAKKLSAAGLTVGMFGSPIGKIDITEDMSTDLNKLRHLRALSDVFSVKKVRVFSYFNKSEKPMDQWQTECLKRLGQLKELAGELGLSLYHENERHIFGDVCWQVEAIAAELRDPGEPGSAGTFRMLFDFDNFNQSGDDVYENWTKLKDVTDAFHLKDSDKDLQHVPMGTGQSHAQKILGEALQRGWQGHLALEPHLARSPAVMATGPGGQANQKLADLSDKECFVFAAETARKLLDDVGATVV